MKLHPIVVDNREKTPSPERRVEELKALGASASVGFLDVGDYMWIVEPDPEDTLPWMQVVVERKSIQDLMASAADGRLARFAQGVEDDLSMRVLLLEGNQFQFPSYGYRDWSPDQLDNLLVTLQSAGLIVIRSSDLRNTAKRLVSFWKYTGRSDRGQSLSKVARPEISASYLNPDKREAVRLLTCLPGWGEQRARAAIEHFGTVSAVLDAVRGGSSKEFNDVAGVGKGMVKKAAAFLVKEV